MSVWKKARKKPVIVEFREVQPKMIMINGNGSATTVNLFAERIETMEGTLFAKPDEDFIIRGISRKGEIYPIKKDIFYKTYEVIEDV